MTYEIVIGRNKQQIEQYGKLGTIFLAKQYVQMGQVTSLANEVYMDIASAHVVFVVGKRGCITGDTKIFTNSGYKDIKDFDETNDLVISFNKNKESFQWENAKLLKYDTKKSEEMIKIQNYDGQELIMTKEHPLLIKEKGKLIWKNAENLKKGDILVGISKVPEVKNDSESLRIARLLGFILADGTMQARKGRFKDGRGKWYNGTKRRVRIINASEDVLKTSKQDLEKEFNITAKRYKKSKENCYVIETKQGKVLRKLNKLGIPLGLKSHKIRVPKVVFESSNKFKANFLKALFSCDGYVNKDGKHIVYYSKSRRFLEDLNLVLNHFNIQSTIRDKIVKLNGKIFPNFQLYITDHNSLESFKKIGFTDTTKEKKLSKHKFWRMKRRKRTKYFNNDVFEQKITKVSKIKGVKEVYDLQVLENNSFIANGIISHNSGKSYTMGVIAEGLASMPIKVRNNLSIVMLDTMGVYWTMKYPNRQDSEILRDWNLEPKPLDVIIFTPIGYYNKYKEEGVPTDYPFSIKPSELSIVDWCLSFGIDRNSDLGVLIERVINDLGERKKDYSIDDIIKAIKDDTKSGDNIKNAAENRFLNTETWGLFSEQGVKLIDLVKPGKITILDVSCYATVPGGWTIKSLVIGLVAQKLFIDRMKQRKTEEFADIEKSIHFFSEKKITTMPLVWLVIDEAHEFLPNKGKTTASDALITILREGRQPGISLILASQQPGKIHTDVMTQSDIIVAHRLTAKIDTDALAVLMQSYMREGLDRQLDNLPGEKGSALIIDDQNERIYPVHIRPRFTWHGGGSPIAIRQQVKKNEFDL